MSGTRGKHLPTAGRNALCEHSSADLHCYRLEHWGFPLRCIAPDIHLSPRVHTFGLQKYFAASKTYDILTFAIHRCGR